MTTCTHGKEDHESCVRCAMVGVTQAAEMAEPTIGGKLQQIDALVGEGLLTDEGAAVARVVAFSVSADIPHPQWMEAHRDGVRRGAAMERARCRAIVARLFGSDWTGNEALRLIDGG